MQFLTFYGTRTDHYRIRNSSSAGPYAKSNQSSPWLIPLLADAF
jgi:hypothetical protein